MTKKINTNATIFDQIEWNKQELQEKLKHAEAAVQEANARLEAEREALEDCNFRNEMREYEQDVHDAEKLVDEAYAAREQIIKEIQNLEK